MRSRRFRRVGRLRYRNGTEQWIAGDPVVHFRHTVFSFRWDLAFQKDTVLYSSEGDWRCRRWKGCHSAEQQSKPTGSCLAEVELCWLSCWFLFYLLRPDKVMHILFSLGFTSTFCHSLVTDSNSIVLFYSTATLKTFVMSDILTGPVFQSLVKSTMNCISTTCP